MAEITGLFEESIKTKIDEGKKSITLSGSRDSVKLAIDAIKGNLKVTVVVYHLFLLIRGVAKKIKRGVISKKYRRTSHCWLALLLCFKKSKIYIILHRSVLRVAEPVSTA